MSSPARDKDDGEASADAPGSGAAPRSFFVRSQVRRSQRHEPLASLMLGDFRLTQFLGRGGMGEVWEAEQISLHRSVAVKLLRLGTDSADRENVRFRREAEAAARIRHAAVVAIHAVGESEGWQYIAQELVEGGYTLADFLNEMRAEKKLPAQYFARVAQLFAEAADGLQAAHEVWVIHRDVKPQNILITIDDHPKVADFGLARIVGADSLSKSGELAGTYGYMSPEQAMAKRIGIDHRTDIFSLGAALYEALTLDRPFGGDTSQEVLQKILFHDPPDPRKLHPSVPRSLALICGKALEKRREDRYASMQQMAEDLRRFLRKESPLAKPPGPARRATKWVRRHPTLSASIGAGTAAGAAVALILAHLRQTSPGPSDAALEHGLKSASLEENSKDYGDAYKEDFDKLLTVLMKREATPDPGAPGVTGASTGDIVLAAARKTFLGVATQNYRRRVQRGLRQASDGAHEPRGDTGPGNAWRSRHAQRTGYSDEQRPRRSAARVRNESRARTHGPAAARIRSRVVEGEGRRRPLDAVPGRRR